MARPIKMGIDYFPMDVDLDSDDKLSMVIGEFGIKGELIYTKLLGWIYKHNGYYSKWDEMEQLKFAKRVAYIGNPSVSLISEIVARCIKWGLFDQSVFESLQVLTSKRIQSTWLDATRKRKDRTIDEQIWVLGVNDALAAEETPKKAEVIDKRKESKVKESKVNKNIIAPAVPKNEVSPSRRNFKAPSLAELSYYVFQTMGNTKKHRPWPEDKCKNFSAQVFDHYTANGWVQGKSRKPIIDWQAAVRTCIRNEIGKTTTYPTQVAQEAANSAPVAPTPVLAKKTLEKPAIELNFLFERFQEDQSKVTIISMETIHYDFLKKSSLINFTKEEVQSIRNKAIEHTPSAQNDEIKLLQLMKKFGVIHFFQQQLSTGKKILFHVDGEATTAA